MHAWRAGHGGKNTDNVWGRASVRGVVLRDAVADWYFDDTGHGNHVHFDCGAIHGGWTCNHKCTDAEQDRYQLESAKGCKLVQRSPGHVVCKT